MSDAYIPSEIKNFQKGDVAFYEGDKNKDLYIITSGEAEVVLARLKPGEFFGEMAMFTNEARTATVRAASDLKAVIIEESNFKTQLEQLPDWFGNMFEVMVERLQDMNNKIISQFKYGLCISILQSLHLLSAQYGTYTEKQIIIGKEFLVNKIHIILGVAFSTLEKQIQSFLSVKLIEYVPETEKIVVNNSKDLDDFLEFYYCYADSSDAKSVAAMLPHLTKKILNRYLD